MSLQGPGSQNDPGTFSDLGATIRSLSERLAKLERGSMLRPAGISVAPEGMTIDSSLTVNGDLTTSGDTTIGGNAAITGTLSLPNGIIDNEALASPLTQLSSFGNSVGFAVPSASGGVLASFTITVPAGFTKASFIAEGASGINNVTGSSNFSYLRVFATGPGGYITWGSRQNVKIDAADTRTAAALLVRAVSVPLVGGDVLTFYCEIFADTAMGASGSNFASTAALVTFTR